MKINFQAPVLQPDGKPFPLEGDKPMLLRDVCVVALNNPQDSDRGGDPKAAFERGVLAIMLYNAGELDVPAEKIALLKERIGRSHSPLVVAQCWAMLEGKTLADFYADTGIKEA